MSIICCITPLAILLSVWNLCFVTVWVKDRLKCYISVVKLELHVVSRTPDSFGNFGKESGGNFSC